MFTWDILYVCIWVLNVLMVVPVTFEMVFASSYHISNVSYKEIAAVKQEI